MLISIYLVIVPLLQMLTCPDNQLSIGLTKLTFRVSPVYWQIYNSAQTVEGGGRKVAQKFVKVIPNLYQIKNKPQ